MADRRTHASVTDIPCTCGYLQQAAEDPGNPIVFNPELAEYHFVYYREPKGKGLSTLVIYHCPFCGGAAPKSKRSLLFSVIQADEESRLAKLLAPVQTIRSALDRLGLPERDEPSGTHTSEGGADGQPPITQHHRTLVYQRLSKVADVWITERPDGQVHWQLIGKYVGPRRA